MLRQRVCEQMQLFIDTTGNRAEGTPPSSWPKHQKSTDVISELTPCRSRPRYHEERNEFRSTFFRGAKGDYTKQRCSVVNS